MRRLIGVTAVLALTLACSPPTGGLTCTEIGASNGVSVTVTRELADELEALTLTVCLTTGCTRHRVELNPGQTTVPEPCPSTASPDVGCAAVSTPDGTAVGFVEVAGLTAGTIRVSGVARVGGRDRRLAERSVEARPTYPNGAACPPEAIQAQITVSAAGIR